MKTSSTPTSDSALRRIWDAGDLRGKKREREEEVDEREGKVRLIRERGKVARGGERGGVNKKGEGGGERGVKRGGGEGGGGSGSGGGLRRPLRRGGGGKPTSGRNWKEECVLMNRAAAHGSVHRDSVVRRVGCAWQSKRCDVV